MCDFSLNSCDLISYDSDNIQSFIFQFNNMHNLPSHTLISSQLCVSIEVLQCYMYVYEFAVVLPNVEQHYVVVSSALPPLLILCLHFLTLALACMDTVRTITFICYFPFLFLLFLLFSFSLSPISIHLIILNPASHVYWYTWYITCITHVLCLPLHLLPTPAPSPSPFLLSHFLFSPLHKNS